MTLPLLIAQGAQSLSPAGLYVYGPLGIISGFFMLLSIKLVALGAKLVTAVKEDGTELRKDIKALTHRMAGLERAMWADLVERDTVGINTKAYARKAIAKIDAMIGES